MSDTRIGKYAIENLTRSMYEDSRCIYREFIQNAADQIDDAVMPFDEVKGGLEPVDQNGGQDKGHAQAEGVGHQKKHAGQRSR